ncbi:MAG: hypothetical protein H6621_12955 [Halobacteriovoraceae bacterium]|nr:hypothetical protein [Halobacteriovoraceae bacterium]MCB9095971.1 hypothetical protein [Halobacteriovoraceae bacterium]
MNSLFRILLFFGIFHTVVYAGISQDAHSQLYLENDTENFELPDIGKDQVRIMWWNILNGALYSQMDGINLVTENIINLSQKKYAPDIMIFGEYILNENHQKIEKELIKKYPYTRFIQYNKKHYRYIAFYSKYPIKRVITERLTWYNSFKDIETWEKRCKLLPGTDVVDYKAPNCSTFFRTFIKIVLTKKDKEFAVYPIHLLQPWDDLKRYYAEKYYSSDLAKLLVLNDIINDRDNPIVIQASKFINKFWGHHKTGEPFVILGDFNIPRVFKYVLKSKPYSYTLFERSFTPAITQGSSFPTEFIRKSNPSFKNFPDMHIDHAFSILNPYHPVFQNAQILPFSGSDHYPISVDLTVK